MMLFRELGLGAWTAVAVVAISVVTVMLTLN